jgi:hypothetical protein
MSSKPNECPRCKAVSPIVELIYEPKYTGGKTIFPVIVCHECGSKGRHDDRADKAIYYWYIRWEIPSKSFLAECGYHDIIPIGKNEFRDGLVRCPHCASPPPVVERRHVPSGDGTTDY